MIQGRSGRRNSATVAKKFEEVTGSSYLIRNVLSMPPQGLLDEINEYLNTGKVFSEEVTTYLKTNMLIQFVSADYAEGMMKYQNVHQIYMDIIENPDINPTLAYIQYMKFARRAEGIKSARNIFRKATRDPRSNYHIYISAAWMEYYCSKDKNIGFNIFELGLRKYGDNPDYVLAYIDYLSHLNDDNNTRVLFERVLSSGTLPPEKQVEIWNRFLEFESNVGDLQSILKVERRRAAVLKELKEFKGKEIALLVDRYKFLDLYPCTPSELKSVGYKETTNKVSSLPSSMLAIKDNMLDAKKIIPCKPRQMCSKAAHPVPGGEFSLSPSASCLIDLLLSATSFQEAANNVPSLPSSMLAIKDNMLAAKKKNTCVYPEPNVSKMIPYKPRQMCSKAAHPVPGGVFSPPPSASYLMTLLPPPTSFQGPFVILDEIIRVIKAWRSPLEYPKPYPKRCLYSDMEKYFHHAINARNNKKRKLGDGLIPPVKGIIKQEKEVI